MADKNLQNPSADLGNGFPSRRRSSVAHVGGIAIGGDNPIRVQSMTTTDTNDTEACVAQIKRIVDAGGELVRLTTQGTREAENMARIRNRVREEGITAPLVADVHFNPAVADVAARYCEKVRINPGNYVDPARTFKKLTYNDEEYAAEVQKIEERLRPFLAICKEHHTAVRIGVNHGSLSDRIMSRFGDTPEGIVESCMEFLRVCRKEDFHDVVLSIKASNTVVMVRSVRLLVEAMDREDMHFPLHLGVTEAGEGVSAVAISSRLSSAAFCPISGCPPAPLPRVDFAPICIFCAALEEERTWLSVFSERNSTLCIPEAIIRFTALPPPPPTPTTLMATPLST